VLCYVPMCFARPQRFEPTALDYESSSGILVIVHSIVASPLRSTMYGSSSMTLLLSFTRPSEVLRALAILEELVAHARAFGPVPNKNCDRRNRNDLHRADAHDGEPSTNSTSPKRRESGPFVVKQKSGEARVVIGAGVLTAVALLRTLPTRGGTLSKMDGMPRAAMAICIGICNVRSEFFSEASGVKVAISTVPIFVPMLIHNES